MSYYCEGKRRKKYDEEIPVCSINVAVVYVGTAVHEFMHALGYMHEQNRADRDQFVFINATNISPDALSQFDKYRIFLDYKAIRL